MNACKLVFGEKMGREMERERVVVTGELSYYNSKSFSVKAESSIRVIGRETRKPEKYIKIEMEIEK